MPLTALKGLSIQTANSNVGTWGAGPASGADLNNGVMAVLDNNLAGISSITLGAVNYTLLAADIQNCCLRLTGTLLANIIISPGASTLFNGFYYFENLTTNGAGGPFTVTVTVGANSCLLPQSRRGVMFVDATNGPRVMSIAQTSGLEVLPPGSSMTFLSAAPPAGWTQQVTLNDYAFRLVSGSGGGTHGSTAFSTVFNQSATGTYALQIADLAPHTHGLPFTAPFTQAAPGSFSSSFSQWVDPNHNSTTQSTGSGNPHSHPISLQPLYVDLIWATKN